MIEKVQLYQYEIPLKKFRPTRQGLLLNFCTDEGQESWGEISPLEGWSKESLNDAKKQILNIIPSLKKKKIEDLFFLALNDPSLYSSVSLGLFGACYPLLHPCTLDPLPVAALLIGSFLEVKEQINVAFEKRFSHVKLKLSHLTVDQAKELLTILKGKVSIRLDLNRSWSQADVDTFFSSYPIDTFEYVEEPYQDAEALDSFVHPLALDESLADENNWNLPRLNTVIIKPSVIGAGQKIRRLISHCKERKIKTVVSSAFESGVGMYQIALLAHYYSLNKNSLGIDTLKFFHDDLLVDKPEINHGFITFTTPKVNIQYLKQVAHA
jgi:O-succinylbenzoate synthase